MFFSSAIRGRRCVSQKEPSGRGIAALPHVPDRRRHGCDRASRVPPHRCHSNSGAARRIRFTTGRRKLAAADALFVRARWKAHPSPTVRQVFGRAVLRRPCGDEGRPCAGQQQAWSSTTNCHRMRPIRGTRWLFCAAIVSRQSTSNRARPYTASRKSSMAKGDRVERRCRLPRRFTAGIATASSPSAKSIPKLSDHG